MNPDVHELLDSAAMGRRVHLWRYGWWGEPLVAFPSAGGYAHEWQQHGMIDALRPWLDAGRVKVYQPEHEASHSWLSDGPDEDRREMAARYRAFIEDEFLDYVAQDCRTPNIQVAFAGCSLGAAYAVLTALRTPERVSTCLGLSGRYLLEPFLAGTDELDPMAVAAHSGAHTPPVDLVCGTGPWEGRCVEETRAMAAALSDRGAPVRLHLLGPHSTHSWSSWSRQIAAWATMRWGAV